MGTGHFTFRDGNPGSVHCVDTVQHPRTTLRPESGDKMDLKETIGQAQMDAGHD